MPQPELIEVLLASELRSLCVNCAKFSECSYRKKAKKIVIQCELYELTEEVPDSHQQETKKQLKGLCVSCCKRDTCCLPDKQAGVWHCEEYE
jgi:hypothetical protein